MMICTASGVYCLNQILALAPAVCHALKSEPGQGSVHHKCRGVCKNQVLPLLVGAGRGGGLAVMLDGGFDVLLCVCVVQKTKLLTCDST